MSEDLRKSRIIDENELEVKIKEANSFKTAGKVLLAISAGLVAPIIIKSYLGTLPEPKELDSLWHLYSFIGGLGSALSFFFGSFAYFNGVGQLDYYQHVKDNSDVQSNLFK